MIYMFDWFKKEQSVNKEKVAVKIVVPCVCESNDGEQCDLISQLREYQKIEKELLKEIELLDRNSIELIFNFVGFLKKLEDNGLVMNNHYGSRIDSYYSSCIVRDTISKYSSADIFRITEELRTYKNKDNIIVEKKRVLIEIQDKIKSIKDKLGIE